MLLKALKLNTTLLSVGEPVSFSANIRWNTQTLSNLHGPIKAQQILSYKHVQGTFYVMLYSNYGMKTATGTSQFSATKCSKLFITLIIGALCKTKASGLL